MVFPGDLILCGFIEAETEIGNFELKLMIVERYQVSFTLRSAGRIAIFYYLIYSFSHHVHGGQFLVGRGVILFCFAPTNQERVV